MYRPALPLLRSSGGQRHLTLPDSHPELPRAPRCRENEEQRRRCKRLRQVAAGQHRYNDEHHGHHPEHECCVAVGMGRDGPVVTASGARRHRIIPRWSAARCHEVCSGKQLRKMTSRTLMAPRTEPAPKMLLKDCPRRLDDVVCGSVPKGKLEPTGVTTPIAAKATADMTAEEPQPMLLGPIAGYRLRNASCNRRTDTAGVLAPPAAGHCTRAEHTSDRPPGRWQP